MAGFEDRLLSLERKVYQLFGEVDSIEQVRMPALEQEMYQLWMLLGSGMDDPGKVNTTVEGRVLGCMGDPIEDGGSVTVLIHGTADELGTFPTADGIWSGGIHLDASTKLDLRYDPGTAGNLPRFLSTASAAPELVNPGASNYAFADLSAGPAAGFYCSLLCNFPLPSSLRAVNTAIGFDCTVTYQTTGAYPDCWVGNPTVDYPGCVADECDPAPGLPLTVILDSRQLFHYGYPLTILYPADASAVNGSFVFNCPGSGVKPSAWPYNPNTTTVACDPLNYQVPMSGPCFQGTTVITES